MVAYVAFFRALNVGGHGIVAMPALKALHESLGLRAVSTSIQSGNVLFSSNEQDSARLARQIEERFLQEFAFASRVALRSSAELEEIIGANPFQPQAGQTPERLVVLFLTTEVGEEARAALERLAAAGPELLQLGQRGRELYLWYANGIGRSPLTSARLERALGCAATGRNWKTVLRLRDLLQRQPL
jgi:uncharacterized protein (DUF1697 family)